MVTSPTDGGFADGDEQGRTDAAKHEAAQVTGTVRDQGAAVTGAAQEAVHRVAGETSSQVANLTEEAGRQFRAVLERSQGELSTRATEQAEKVSVQLKDLAGELKALADGRPDDAPRAKGYVRQAAERVEGYGGRLDSGGFAGVAEDLGRFARRRPGTFLLGALAAGFVAGRLARGAQAAGGDDTSTNASPGGGTLGMSTGGVAPISPPPPAPPPRLVTGSPVIDPVGFGRNVVAEDPVIAGAPLLVDDPVEGSPTDVTEVSPPSYLVAGPEETRQR
jgi:hypothetical protein